MDTSVNIMLPVAPEIIGVFLGCLVVALVYYGIKFAWTLVVGG